MVLAFFVECECPPDRRAATIGGGGLASVDDFMKSYPLTHIECGSCRTYYRLIGWIDESGVERPVTPLVEASPRPRKRFHRLARSTR